MCRITRASRQPNYPVTAIPTINTPGTLVGFTEGAKKALAATQASIPTIGLSGVNAWSLKSERDQDGKRIGERVLSDDLAVINWKDRPVIICFDTDPKHNSDVEREEAELLRALTSLGADARIVRLPVFVNSNTGQYIKIGIDDFIVRRSEEVFRQLIDRTSSRAISLPLEVFRSEMERKREMVAGSPGVFLDRSPTGTGKSHSDIAMIRRHERSLTVVPSHDQCAEIERQYADAGIYAVCFPQLSNKNCRRFDEMNRTQALGLNATPIHCPSCPRRLWCDYHRQIGKARNAQHKIVTQDRFVRSFKSLRRVGQYVTIHENILDLAARTIEVPGDSLGHLDKMITKIIPFTYNLDDPYCKCYPG